MNGYRQEGGDGGATGIGVTPSSQMQGLQARQRGDSFLQIIIRLVKGTTFHPIAVGIHIQRNQIPELRYERYED